MSSSSPSSRSTSPRPSRARSTSSECARALVPLDTVAKKTDKPTSLTVNHIAQLPAVMISFNLAPGVALGEAVKSIQEVAGEAGLPPQIATSFEGSAQVFQQAVANQGLLLFAAVLVIYIILG